MCLASVDDMMVLPMVSSREQWPQVKQEAVLVYYLFLDRLSM